MPVCAICSCPEKQQRDTDDAGRTITQAAVRWVNTTLPQLRASSGDCRDCALLLNGVLFYHGRFANIQEDKIKIIAETLPEKPSNISQQHLSVELRWQEPEDGCGDAHDHGHAKGYPDVKLEFFTDQHGQSAFSAIGCGRPIITSPLHETGINKISSMVDRCNTNHPLCSNRRSDQMPHRLLDVSIEDPSRGIRVVEFEANDPSQVPYLTLSYCWGIGRGMPQTTIRSLKAHKENIAWTALPKTFQEAVLLTKKLGVQYLWIDSLCVIQDDASDRLRTAFELDSIFGNALLTLAATSSEDPTQGLFGSTTPPFKIQVTDSKGSLVKVYVREQPSHYSFKAPFNEGSHMNDWELPFNTSKGANARTPLLRRAWAYAERLLSSRVLHFTDSEMILECGSEFQCECGRIDDATYDSRTTDSFKQELTKILAEGSSDGTNKRINSVVSSLEAVSITDSATTTSAPKAADALELWSYIVTEYSARNLAYDEDRLLAIAGVAKRLASVTHAGYIAGHWTTSTLGLLWYPHESTHCKRPNQAPGRNVPSWTWASIEGSPIFFDNTSAMDLACSASFPASGSNAPIFSPVSGDAIELSAAMAVDVTFCEDVPNEYSLTRSGISVEFQPDVIPVRGEDMVRPGDTLVCVLISMSFRSSILGLVLKKSHTKVPVYRRIGRFECYECVRDGSNEDPEDAEALFEHWFPEVDDMTQLDDRPRQTFRVL